MVNNVKISSAEIELLNNAVSRIITGDVQEKEFDAVIPLQDDLADANKIYKGKVSMLFVDMRESTRMSEQYNPEQLVKIYRSYVRAVIQAVRYSDGVVRDFMGDGLLAAFVDGEEYKSGEKAVRAARYIATAIDKILNPILDSQVAGFRISCGIGICTGSVMMTKVGMKGRESKEDIENEFGVAWIGDCTNYASKFSGIASRGTIFIDKNTLDELENDKEKWTYIEKIRNKNLLKGYIAEKYYLETEQEMEAFVADDSRIEDNAEQEMLNGIKDIFDKYIREISQKSESIGHREETLKRNEIKNRLFYTELKNKEDELLEREKDLKEGVYSFYRNILCSGHCQSEYVCKMKRKFWEDNLQKFFAAGKEIGKSEYEMKMDISFAMVSIYQSLQLYSEAYDYLVEQARGYAWLNASTVKEIVGKTGYHTTLKNVIEDRLYKGEIQEQYREGFVESKKVLIDMGY